MSINFEQIADLYATGLSASEVGKRLGVSQWSVYKKLKSAGIERRTSAESNRLAFQARPLSFNKLKQVTVMQEKLWMSGLLLYLGEGSKKSDSTVDLANCNKQVLQIFLRMLLEIYGVNPRRIRIYLYCHDNTNPNYLVNYWSSELRIARGQFTKPYVKAGSRGIVSGKMEHGLVHIRYSDKKLWQEIMNDLDLLVDNLLG